MTTEQDPDIQPEPAEEEEDDNGDEEVEGAPA
jgi:hypothetical protein